MDAIAETLLLYLDVIALSEKLEDDAAGAEAWELVGRLSRPALAGRAAKPELLERARAVLAERTTR